MALRYVERFATTRAKLAAYLARKLRERGWAEDGPPPVEPLVERIAALGYVDDRAWGEAKAAAMARRGLGARRVRQALGAAGVAGDDVEAINPMLDAGRIESAVAYARRRRIGPYAREAPDRDQVERHVAQMVRAGHAPDLSRRIARTRAEALDAMSQSEQLSGIDEQLIRSLS
ncbi:regulatory protein RecX [Sphingomonas sp.]|uniref:regulatory protein RecX n=1 Tax=Sphingomonas sp. TaxID=28214 RepID=UPI002CC74646|nr:RecX family transcriptional regulator [Sphingomonas sp.]HTG38656.1 RecX family transcriptional regulator [Sphingomonas sp.]